MTTRLEGFRKKIRGFRTTPWFSILILVALGFLVAELFPITFGNAATACLGLLLIPLVVLVIPYWLGERRVKRFALNALPVFLIAVVLIGLFQTQTFLALPPPVLDSGAEPGPDRPFVLSNGTVDPYRGTPSDVYTFHVQLRTAAGWNNSTPVRVYLNLTIINGLDRTEESYLMHPDTTLPSTNGTWYVVQRQLGASVYGFGFWANDTRENVTATVNVLGPITAPAEAYYGFFVYLTALYLLIPVSLYFVFLFMYWYTARMRRMRSRYLELGEAKTGGKAKEKVPEPPPREKTARAAAYTCTNCGADVSEDEEKCPKCGAVFED